MKKLLSIILSVLMISTSIIGVNVFALDKSLTNKKIDSRLLEVMNKSGKDELIHTSIWFNVDKNDTNKYENYEYNTLMYNKIFLDEKPEIVYMSLQIPEMEVMITKSEIERIASLDEVYELYYAKPFPSVEDSSTTQTPYQRLYNYFCEQGFSPEYSTIQLYELGNCGNFILFYGSESSSLDSIEEIDINGYHLYTYAHQLPYAMGLYLLDDSNVYTLEEAIEKFPKEINMDDVAYYVATCKESLTVTITRNDGESVIKTEVQLPKKSATLYVKNSVSISPLIKRGLGKTTYKSNNAKVAKVDSKGKVTAVNKGTAKITVTNNGVKKVFNVTVKNPKLNKKSVTLKKGKSVTLKITGKVGKATFRSSNKKVVSVNKTGNITAKKRGSATISVNTNGITLKCKVKVK